MATLKLAVTPDKVAKDGSHKIRIALGHKSVTRYIVTRFKIDHLSQFKNGQIVKRPDAAIINTKLRNLLNEYQEKLDSIRCIQMYDCRQLREILINSTTAGHTAATFQAVAGSYITELIEDGRGNYMRNYLNVIAGISRNLRKESFFCQTSPRRLFTITPGSCGTPRGLGRPQSE